jgi:transcriptional regulator with GAF, ATPase, and Fis domain/serine/threonine protein kinase
MSLKEETVNERYRITGLVGRGEQATVYAACDLAHPARPDRALKILQDSRGSRACELLSAEFVRLKQLAHPNLTRVHDLDMVRSGPHDLEPGQIFFTADLVDGSPPEPGLPGFSAEERAQVLWDILYQVGSVLDTLHAHHLLHRDIKPGNILVDDDDKVWLLDLGLSAARDDRRPPAGTLAYMAPESIRGVSDPRSDLYGLGATIFHLASGASPREGCRSFGEAVREALEKPIPRLDEVVDWAPEQLVEVVASLTALDAGARYSSARSMLEDIRRRTRVEPYWTTPETAVETPLFRPALCGRRDELSSLLQAIEAASGENLTGPNMVAITGRRGFGRARLIEEGIRSAQLRAMQSAAGPSRAMSFFTSGWSGLLQLTVEEGSSPNDGSRSATDRDTQSLYHEAAQELERLSALCPTLLTLDVEEPNGAGFVDFLGSAPEPGLRNLLVLVRAERSTGERLERMGDHVMRIDLAPLDRDDVAGLARSMLGVEIPDSFISSLMSASGGVPGVVVELLEAAWAKCGSRAKVVEIDPCTLSGEALLEIYSDRLRAVSRDARRLVRHLAIWGRPLPARLLAEMAELDDASTWRAVEQLMAAGLVVVEADRISVGQVLAARAAVEGAPLHHLKAWKRRTAEVMAKTLPDRPERLIDQPVTVEAAEELSALARITAELDDEAAATRLCVVAAHLCERTHLNEEAARLFETAAPLAARLAEAVSARRQDEMRPPEADPSELVLRAAAAWIRAGGYDRAVEVLGSLPVGPEGIAPPGRSESLVARASYLKARALQRQGRYDDAEEILRRARSTGAAGENDDQMKARALLARLLVTRGEIEEAVELTRDREDSDRGRASVELLEAAGLARFYAGKTGEALSLYESAERLARQNEDLAVVARQLNLQGMVHHKVGDLERAGELYSEASRLAERASDPHGLAHYGANQGCVMWEHGDFGAALEALSGAVRNLRRLGRTAELAGTLMNLANTLLRLGDVRAAAREALLALDQSADTGAELARGYAMLVVADLGTWLHLPNLTNDWLESAAGGGGTARSAAGKLPADLSTSALGDLSDRLGDPVERAQEAGRIFSRLGCDSEAIFAEASQLSARVATSTTGTRSAAPSGEAAGRLITVAEHEEIDLSARLESLRATWLAWLAGSGEVASSRLHDIAEELAARLGDTQLREWRWRVGLYAAAVAYDLGDDVSLQSHIGEAKSLFSELIEQTPEIYRSGRRADPEARLLVGLDELAQRKTAMSIREQITPEKTPNSTSPPSTGGDDRLRRLLAINKRLNSEHRLEPLLDFILDSVIDLTKAERGFLILKEGAELEVKTARNMDREELERGDDRQAKWSRSIARQTLDNGEPILTVDAAEDRRFSTASSVMDMRLRSVLTVPLVVKGKAVGTIYVDNRLRRGAFEQEDAEIALDFADQAAIAIENARLVEINRRRQHEIEQLNEKLRSKLEAQEATMQDIRAELVSSRQALRMRYDYSNIVGRSPTMLKVFQLLDRVTETDLPVVLQGESGTGKELAARALHYNGPRHDKPFVSENCAAVPDTLLESVLFGHEKGAFTGASRQQRGLFEIAHEGTLFLDEVGDMSLAMQVKLLRALQDGEFRRVGGDDVIRVDVRIIAASNQELSKLVDEGKLRQDLYYRLNVVTITLPPLRSRAEDIPLLAAHFLEKHVPEGKPLKIDPKALARLQAYEWPGNVRQLENEMMRAAALSEELIQLEDLSAEVLGTRTSPPDVDPDDLDIKKRVAHLEKILIQQALDRTEGNRTQAAKLLGLSRYGLIKKLDRLGLG